MQEFIVLLYNRQPKSADDLPLKFCSSIDPDLQWVEEAWEARIRAYLKGKGTPSLAGWVPLPNGMSLQHRAGRARLFLKVARGSALMPVDDDWNITVSWLFNLILSQN